MPRLKRELRPKRAASPGGRPQAKKSMCCRCTLRYFYANHASLTEKTSKPTSPAGSGGARSPEEEGANLYGTPPPVNGPYYGRAALAIPPRSVRSPEAEVERADDTNPEDTVAGSDIVEDETSSEPVGSPPSEADRLVSGAAFEGIVQWIEEI